MDLTGVNLREVSYPWLSWSLGSSPKKTALLVMVLSVAVVCRQ